jgi:hypothetical protein
MNKTSASRHYTPNSPNDHHPPPVPSSKQIPGIQPRRVLLHLPLVQTQLFPPRQRLALLLHARDMPTRLGSAQLGADLVGRNEPLVLVDDGAAKGTLLDDDGREDEPRTDLNQIDIRVLAVRPTTAALFRFLAFLAVLFAVLVALNPLDLADLVVAHPNLAVRHAERHDVVDKGLGLARTLRDAKDLHKDLLDDAQVGFALEGAVEGEDRPRALEAVALEVELFHGVDCGGKNG